MKRVLITGGAGFIGSNLAARLIEQGNRVTVFDNLSRASSPKNVEWLKTVKGADAFELIVADIRDVEQIQRAAVNQEVIYHLAAQVAVTTSVADPRHDFEVNALGTFNVLEAARLSGKNPIVIYASTNKVYGGMEDLAAVEEETRYRFADEGYRHGVPESRELDFHSPYGCSKGAGDQYCRDYFRIYGLPTVVFRQSCIYGPRQFGVEDQGWLAWFVIAALTQRPITIFGDGKQVRDLLHISDLLDAYELAVEKIDVAQGQIYNIGGGPEQTLSIWSELAPMLRQHFPDLQARFGEWRPGDQRVFISSIQKLERELAWRPRIDVAAGIEDLIMWLQDAISKAELV
ncbi:GDP-mannose 4,6-dehydratase [Candidatus Chloroploca sp. Khr17]|uniref:NAD-dependent epimerase/dehydratase family protein n=1 Tax=Candidatus Chloroploca sp. Khr17 TaxID=2496869 RepID=UPI00101C1BB4|nr:GDP-mannose 4,6-dehydratase [Candidatus Chloroploca sp. Khr17]